MTEIKIQHSACPDCGSTTAMTVWEGGNTYCNSCGVKSHVQGDADALLSKDYSVYSGSPKEPKDTLASVGLSYKTFTSLTKQVFPIRGLSIEAQKKFSTHCLVDADGAPVFMVCRYGPNAAKIRKLPKERFEWEGDAKTAKLFGQGAFPPGSARAIIVTEGEIDAISAYQMTGCPAVSIKNGAQSALKCCETARDYLNSFAKIYLCFDNDADGERATKVVQRLFGSKVYVMKLGELKDANEFLTRNKKMEFKNIWLNSELYLPDGIVGSYLHIEEILKGKASAPIGEYPFSTLNQASLGIRSSEMVLLTAQEGVGKTEIVRSIEHHLLKTTDYNMGVIHLEETEQRSVQGLIGYEMRKPVHLPATDTTIEEQLEVYKALTRKDGRLYFYPHFGSDDPNVILDIIRYMATACECKFIFLDHITMVVTGFENDDERKKLDYLSTRMAMLVTELDFTLFLVSHVNDDNKTRGSRNISKVAHLWLHLDRNLESESLDARNTTRVTIKKNRFGGTTGPCGALFFDASTFTLSEKFVLLDDEIKDPF